MANFRIRARRKAAPTVFQTGIIFTTGLLALLGTAQAATFQCDGVTVSTGVGKPAGTNQHQFAEDLEVSVGDRITVVTGSFQIQAYDDNSLTTGQIYTVTQDDVDSGNGIVYVLNSAFELGSYAPSSYRCDPAASLIPETPPTEETTAPSLTQTVNSAAQTSVTTQTSSTQTAINTNIAGRFGGAGISAKANGLTVSTHGLDTAVADLGEPELNAWVSVEGRRFTGSTTGDSRNLSFGVDHLFNPNLVIGGYVSYNDQSATVAGSATSTKSPLFGAYAAQKLNNGLFFSGFVGFGRPDYTIGTTSFRATRNVVGLSLSGQVETGNLRLTPLASLLASRENLPAAGILAADRLENTQASLSLRAEPLQRLANGILPYASLAAEYRRQGSDLMSYESFTKPRLGLGIDWQMAAGSIRFDVDYGSITSTANDLGASLVYDFSF